jgi:hypothetical protein
VERRRTSFNNSYGKTGLGVIMIKKAWIYFQIFIIQVCAAIGGKGRDWEDETDKNKPFGENAGMSEEVSKLLSSYDPDKIDSKPTPSKFSLFMRDIASGAATVSEAHIMLGKMHGESLCKHSKDPYKIVKLNPPKATEKFKESASKELKETDWFDVSSYGTDPDQNQYSEYTPIMGGPFYRQMYLYDMLSAHAKSFEAYNHNIIAHRIVNILKQYALGRGYKVMGDERFLKIWDKFEKSNKIKTRLRKNWTIDYLVTGEFLFDKITKDGIDSSTIWEIITDPQNIRNVYYYYQSFPTQYQLYPGMKVSGVAGSEKTQATEYVLRQIPYDRVIHIKSDGMTWEKRGRPCMFPILAWLKRHKDYWDANILREISQASYVYDVTVNGGAGDVSTIAQQFSGYPKPLSTYTHNDAVSRTLLSPVQGSGGKADAAEQLIAMITACVGIPKEFFNMAGLSNRANALVSSEPFTKVIDDLQQDFEEFLQELARLAFEEEGLEYNNELEFIFPSVIKDTTTESLKNFALCQSMGWLSMKRCATMAAAEMNVTNYDFEAEQEDLKEEREAGLLQAEEMPPDSRFGSTPTIPTHGQGKIDLQKDMNNL